MRAVLLGASNLARGIGTAVTTAGLVLGSRELDVYAAHGHGRSYGTRSGFLGRSVPSILECGLWKALREASPAALYALITDVGNDVAYGADAASIAGWVEECARRLEVLGARLVMTSLPIASLERLSDASLTAARRFFFPFAAVQATDVRREVAELDERLREVAARHGASWVEHRPEWYGIDPIHIRRTSYPDAWTRMLAPWSGGLPTERAQPSLRRFVALRRALPESWIWARHDFGQKQPAAVLSEGERVCLY